MSLGADDRFAIQDLYASQFWALDTGDVEAYVGTFTADAVLEMAERHEGRDAIRRFAIAFRAGDPWLLGSQHAISQLRVEGDGVRATVRAYVQRFHRLPGWNRNNSSVVWVGHYDDVLRKQDGTWRFERQFAKAWEGSIQQRVADARPAKRLP